MKKMGFVAVFTCLSFTLHARGALLFPILNPVRSAIVTNIEVITNSASLSTEQARQLRFLRLAQRNLDRRGAVSLFNDVQVLASVTTVLGRAFPDGEFDALLQEATANYYAALLDFALALSTNVSQMPASRTTTIAANNIADALDILGEFDPAAGLSAQTAILTRATSRLRTAQLFTSRFQRPTNRRDRLSAIVDGRSFQANTTSGLSATYNPSSQFLTVTGREAGSVDSTTRTITLFIGGVLSGTTTHSLGDPATGTYATLTVASPTNSASFTSSSGNAVITLDGTNGTVSGRFSFNADNTVGPAPLLRVTAGDFSIQF